MKPVFIVVMVAILTGCAEAGAGKQTEPSAPQNNTTTSVAAQPVADSSSFTSITWDSNEKDFGKMKEGEKLEAKFTFKNTGDKPLVIESARASCGCTVAEYTKEPVPPGGSGEVKGVFDSQGKPGHQKKSVYVTANTKGTQSHELNFTVEVVGKKP